MNVRGTGCCIQTCRQVRPTLLMAGSARCNHDGGIIEAKHVTNIYVNIFHIGKYTI